MESDDTRSFAAFTLHKVPKVRPRTICQRPSFLRLNSISVYGQIEFCLFFLQLVDIWVRRLSGCCEQRFCEHLCTSFCVDIRFPLSWNTPSSAIAELMAAPFSVPTMGVRGFWLFHTLTNARYHLTS